MQLFTRAARLGSFPTVRYRIGSRRKLTLWRPSPGDRKGDVYRSALSVASMLHEQTDWWDPDHAIYDDGEWITWTEINSHLALLEARARYPDLPVELVPVFQSLLAAARDYHNLTGNHLQVYGDLGELYGAIVHGIKLHRNYAQGSDGKLGNDFVEVKTITPFKRNDTVTLNLKRNFSKVLVVRIDANFEVQGRLLDRKTLPKSKGSRLRLKWADLVSDAVHFAIA